MREKNSAQELIKMPAILNLEYFKTSNNVSKLYIEVQSGQRPSYRFYPNEFIVDKKNELKVQLTKDSIFEGVNSMDIFSYCVTDIDAQKVKAAFIFDATGTPTKVTDQDKEFAQGTSAVTFEIDLPRRQLIFIGVIIRIVRNGMDEYYLCDPQVGNGPPGSGGLLYALSLTKNIF